MTGNMELIPNPMTQLEEYALLQEAQTWSTEKIAQDYSFISECARKVLESDTSGHEKQVQSIKWLAFLIEYVPVFDLEIDILKPLLGAIDRILENVNSVVDDHIIHSSACEKEAIGEPSSINSSEVVTLDDRVKNAFISLISKLLA
jgi:hypothetical protein